MDVYAVITLVHVAAAVALLACSVIASPAVRVATRRAATTQEMRAYFAIGRPLPVLEPGSAFVVLITGIYMTSVAGFWRVPWVQVAVAFWVVNAVVAGMMVKPALDRVAQALAEAPDGPIGETLDVRRRSARWSLGGDILLANDAAMLYLMVMQPGMAGSLVTVAVVNVIIAVLRMSGSRRTQFSQQRKPAA
jgi:hypothetical protein